MLPSALTATQFSHYPPQARKLATDHLGVLQRLPLAFEPLLLRETMAYDWKFPAERKELESEYAYLSAMPHDQLQTAMSGFAGLKLPNELEQIDWVNQPADFSERLTAHLWATHQIDSFRTASVDYVHNRNVANTPEKPALPRLAIVMAGKGVARTDTPLFRKLRRYGTYYTNVAATNGRALLLEEVTARATKVPESFAHWYIDGGAISQAVAGPVTLMSYDALEPVRSELVAKMRRVMQPDGGGPEKLRSMLAQMRPEDVGLSSSGNADVLNRFQISVLTEGSGTQVFSTTFVQWSAREVLRRAQPLTLVARFTPRLQEQSMKDVLSGTVHAAVPDPEGSLIDADMGAYYTWINLQRLPDAERSSFLVWFEDHSEALAISSHLKPNTENSAKVSLQDLVRQIQQT